MGFRSYARGHRWCGIIYYYWWTSSIKPRLLLSRTGYASWGLSLSSVFLSQTRSMLSIVYTRSDCHLTIYPLSIWIKFAMYCYKWLWLTVVELSVHVVNLLLAWRWIPRWSIYVCCSRKLLLYFIPVVCAVCKIYPSISFPDQIPCAMFFPCNLCHFTVQCIIVRFIY